jgi:arabinofuranosyltransferase
MPAPAAPGRLGASALALAGAGLLALVVARAWVCDDAYISFRVVDNALHGFGLRWNVDERVEVYTHPLWLLVHLPLVALFGNVFLATLGLSLVCSALAVVAGMGAPARPAATRALAWVLPLALSRSFVDYATSGLETPLSFLLFALFARLLLREGRPAWLWLAGSAALAGLNRLDTLLLYLPALALLLAARPREARLPALALGFLPLAAWQVFRLVYYGFAFPNTKYAKLDAGIAASAYAAQGLRYLADFAVRDPASLALLVLCCALSLAGLAGAGERRLRQPELGLARRRASLALGVLAYCVYVILVGGDFMAGRFFALPVFASAWLVYAATPARLSWPPLLALAGGLALLRLASAGLPALGVEPPGRSAGIADERAFYAASNALLDPAGGLRTRADTHAWARYGARMRAGLEPRTLEHGAVGMLGYHAGPEALVIDTEALCDALLARLPTVDTRRWRIGHLTRAVPAGYRRARETGSLDAMQPELAEYYRALRLVTAGPLFAPERLRAVLDFQLGRYTAPLATATQAPPPAR